MVSREEILAACDDIVREFAPLPTIPAWRVWQADLSTLTKHAVDSRYPEEIATASDAENAMRICGEVREAVRTELKLSHEGDSSN